ncbi:hypothetical protein CLOM_g22218 [Closterium sp. NIES-68]|nr:hypothetical protein CLOM_g22218 [Closterium sp. NIES-68]
MPRAQRECGHKVKVIRSDNGGELIGADFEGELKRKGIQHQLTVPYNPQQNGEKRGKLEASGRWGVHLGIAKDHKGWLLWDLTTQKLTVSRDVKFFESLYYKEWKQQQQKLPSTPLIVEVDEPERPRRDVRPPVRLTYGGRGKPNVVQAGSVVEQIEEDEIALPKWHWVRRLLDEEVRLEIVKTHQQAADIFTKRLAEADHWKGMKLAGMSVH